MVWWWWDCWETGNLWRKSISRSHCHPQASSRRGDDVDDEGDDVDYNDEDDDDKCGD